MTLNYVSFGIVQKIYQKTLNILCYPTIKLLFQIHYRETMLDVLNYLWRLLHMVCILMEVYEVLNDNSVSTFRDKSSVSSLIIQKFK